MSGLTVRGRVEERFVGRVSDDSPCYFAVQEGRVDGVDGYVNGYRHKGTYGVGMARTR